MSIGILLYLDFRVLGGNSKNSNPKFTRERQIFHYTFLFDAYVAKTQILFCLSNKEFYPHYYIYRTISAKLNALIKNITWNSGLLSINSCVLFYRT